MKRFTVVLDNSPHPPAPWMKRCCETLGLVLVDNDAIAEEVSKIKELQPVLIGENQGPLDPRLAPHFLATVEKLVAGKQRIAVHGANWLALGMKTDAFVVDLDAIEAEKQKVKDRDTATRTQVAAMLDTYEQKLKTIADRYPGKDRTLILPKGTPEAKKAEQAIAFVKRWDGK
jgi:hypothetical protein